MANYGNYKIIIKKLFDNFNKFLNNFIDSKFTKEIIDKVKYFVNNFKIFIILFIFFILSFYFIVFYRKNYSRNRIKFYFNNSEYVSNAVAINRFDFLTSYNPIKNSCKNLNGGKRRFFLISSNRRFEVYLKSYDEYKNLAVLSLRSGKNSNFVLFKDNNSIDNIVFLSKTSNSLFYKYYKFNLKSKNGYDYLKTFDFLRDYSGEILINSNLEFIGIVNSENDHLFGKKIFINNSSIVKQFLDENSINFISNYENIDLRSVRNYISDLNYKLICFVEFSTRPPTLIRIPR